MALGLYGFRNNGNIQIDRAEKALEIWNKSNLLLQRVVEAGLGNVSALDSGSRSRDPYTRHVDSPQKEVECGWLRYTLALRGHQETFDKEPDQADDWKMKKLEVLQLLKDNKLYSYASISHEGFTTLEGNPELDLVQYYDLEAGARDVAPIDPSYEPEDLLSTDRELLLAVSRLAVQIEAELPQVSA